MRQQSFPGRNPFIILCAAALLALPCTGKPRDRNVVATVNGTPILQSELQCELDLHAQQNPGAKITQQTVEDHIKSIIDRKLMLQAAIKARISEDPAFAETIKRFWEQTLVRQLIEAKNREWEGTITVSDGEIRQAYDRMQYEVLVRAVRAKDRNEAKKAEEKMRNNGAVTSAERIGPFFFDDVKLTPLEHAFDLAEGGVGVYPVEEGYLVLRVERKRAIACPSLEHMRERLFADIRENKREKAMAAWMESLRKSAKISLEKPGIADEKP